MSDLKWFEFSQNNSGGSFDKLWNCDADNIHENNFRRVFVEAPNENFAIKIMEMLGAYWDGVESGTDCECCGDRWYPNPEELTPKNYAIVSEYSFENKYFAPPKEYKPGPVAFKFGNNKPIVVSTLEELLAL